MPSGNLLGGRFLDTDSTDMSVGDDGSAVFASDWERLSIILIAGRGPILGSASPR